MDNTIIQQGTFTSDGTERILQLRNGVDWIRVVNFTQSGAQNNAGVNFYWQAGMANGSAVVQAKVGGGDDIEQITVTSGGFSFIDISSNPVGALAALTSISNATPPRVLVASTAGLTDGDVVRFINVTGAQQLGGIDFEIDVIDGTHFDLSFMSAIVAATTGHYRVIAHGPLFEPVTRFITAISNATEAVITCSVTPKYSVGQKVRIVNPDPAYGMNEINGLAATILDVDETNAEITVNIDSSAFSAFAFPVTAETPFTPAQVVPFGEDTGEANLAAVNPLGDSVENTGFIGVALAAGADSPAGQNNDVIFWTAGTSFSDL